MSGRMFVHKGRQRALLATCLGATVLAMPGRLMGLVFNVTARGSF